MEDVLESNDITLSREELYSIVSSKTGENFKDVETVMESFINLFLKKFKLK